MAGRDVQDQDITALASESLLLELTDQHLEWKFLGRHLGLTEGNLVDIERDNKGSSKEMKYQTLLQWKRTSGQRATIGKLAKALKKAGRTDLADYVMQVHGDTPRCPLLEWNGATAPANSQGANDKSEGKAEAPLVVDLVNDKNEIQMTFKVGSQSGDESATYVSFQLRSNIGSSVSFQLRSNIGSSVSLRLQSNIGSSDKQLQFEPEEFGDHYVDGYELSILATRIFQNHGGKELSDVPYFCCQLGIPSSVYYPVCMDKKQSRTDELLYYVFLEWSVVTALTRNKLRKALFDFDQVKKPGLCNLYEDIVNDRFREDSSESS